MVTVHNYSKSLLKHSVGKFNSYYARQRGIVAIGWLVRSNVCFLSMDGWMVHMAKPSESGGGLRHLANILCKNLKESLLRSATSFLSWSWASLDAASCWLWSASADSSWNALCSEPYKRQKMQSTQCSALRKNLAISGGKPKQFPGEKKHTKRFTNY